MGQVTVRHRPEVINYLNQLAYTLFEKDYFHSLESAVTYKNKIIEFIDDSIVTFPSKETPANIQYLGSNYIFYKSNQRTTWYIFFEQKGNDFLITNILNNNSEEIKWL